MTGGVLDVLEAAYRAEPSDAEWVRGVAEAMAPLVDEGVGVQAFTFDLQREGHVLSNECLVGGEPAWEALWRDNWWDPFMAGLDPETCLALVAFSPVSYASQVWHATSRDIPTFGELLRELAGSGYAFALGEWADASFADDGEERLFYPDSFNVCGVDPSGVGLVIVANRRERATRHPTREMHDFARIAAHLATAIRLRRRTDPSDPRVSGEAVFDEQGRLVHAEGPASASDGREALRLAASNLRRARGRRGLGADETLSLWRALHEGRWSLVDVFDSDGKRFLVARENVPDVASSEVLAPRELQAVTLLGLGLTNKAIAYELGLEPSTVATLIGRARAKLGLTATIDLIRWARKRGLGRAAT